MDIETTNAPETPMYTAGIVITAVLLLAVIGYTFRAV